MLSLRVRLLFGFSLVALSYLCVGVGQAKGDEPADLSKSWTETVDRGIRFLRGTQGDDGGWSSATNPGVTGVVLTGLMETGRMGPDDPAAAKALKFIEALVNEKEGHIAGRSPRVQLQNYVTSINVMALRAADRSGTYKKVVGDAVQFLKKLQWDESEGKGPESEYYGGAGYD